MFEIPKQSNTREAGWSYKGENLKLTFEMQVELARRFYGLPESASREELDSIVFRWADPDTASNSKKFREFVEAHPEVVELFKRDREAALSRIEESIYEVHH